MSNTAQRSFSGGELAPALHARTDLAKYATGLRTCRNFMVNRYGGVSNRPGLVYVGATKSNGVVHLVRFEFSTDQTYLLEFGDRYLRWYSLGGRVVVASATAWADATAYVVADLVSQGGVLYYCTAAHTSATATDRPGDGSSWASVWSPLTMDGTNGVYEIPTPYLAADLARLQTMQVADVVTIVHPSYAPRELKRFGHTQWTLSPIAFGPSIAAPTNVSSSGAGIAGVDTYYVITAISSANGDESLPSAPLQIAAHIPDATHNFVLAWDPVPGASSYAVYRSSDGQTFGFVGDAGGVPILRTVSSWTTDTATASTSSLGSWVASASQARITVLTTAAERPHNGSFNITGIISISTLTESSSLSGRIRAYYSRDSEPRVDAGVIATISESMAGSASAPFIGTVLVPDNGYANLKIDLVPEVLGEAGTDTFSCSVDETTPGEVTWRSTVTGFTDDGVVPQFDIGPPTDPAVFLAPNDYPAAVSSFQQRRMFGNTNNAPEIIRGSRTKIPQSFTTSTPLVDDDALSFQLASQELNEVRHMRDLGRLLVFASSGEWIAEGDNSNILKPTAINARRFSAYGAAWLPPITIGTAAIYVQARNTVVRDLTVDTVQGITSNEISVFSAHLFDGYTIVDWDFAQIPHNIAWLVRSDGVLLGLTYLPEQQVLAWHRHDTDGAVENVCVVPEGSEDAVYAVVRRTINGATVRYVERLSPRTITALTDVRNLIFMDAALSYDGRNTGAETMTLSGGVAWDEIETLTITRSVGGFTTDSVGDAVVFYDVAGNELARVNILAYTSPTIVTGRPTKAVPVGDQNSPALLWGYAPTTLTGLDHLEGKAVSVFADGAVVASPNNSRYGDPLVVDSGSITLATPAVVVHIGLPYLADLETLDIDTPQGPSFKPFKLLVNELTAMVEKSWTFWAGGATPTGADPLANLDIAKFRDADDNYALTALKTGPFATTIQNRWNSHGRVFIRQPDPVPLTVLAVIPQGNFPPPA